MTRKILVPMNVHNAFHECDEAHASIPSHANAVVSPFLQPLISELSKKRPAWTYVFDGYGVLNDNGQYEYNHFTIMVEGEKTGRVWRETHWRTRQHSFAFDNKRLRAARQRGQHTETKHLKKAVKLILENMHGTTPHEFMAAARGSALPSLQGRFGDYFRDFSAAKNALVPDLINYALDNPEAIKSAIPKRASDVDHLILSRAQLDVASKVEAKVANQHFSLLVERGDKVYTERADIPGCFVATPAGDMPEDLKQAFGVLKLAPNNTLVPDLGYRASDDVFIVFNKEKSNAEGTA